MTWSVPPRLLPRSRCWSMSIRLIAVAIGGALLIGALWPRAGEAASVEPDRITLQLKWTHQFQFAGYYAALEQGYFRDANLDVTIVPGGPAVNIVDEVVSGRADVGIANSSVVLDRAAGKPIVVLGVVYQHSPLALLVRADRLTDSIHTLRGRTLMIEPHSGDLLAMLQHERVPLDQLTIVPHPGNLDGLIRGEADAISTYLTDASFVADRVDFRTFIFTPRAYGIDFYGDTFFTREDIARGRPDLARRFREATIRGWEYAFQHQDEVIDLILEKYPAGKSRHHLTFEAERSRELILPDLIQPGYMRRERWEHIVDTYVNLGMLAARPSLDELLFEPHAPIVPPWFWPATVATLSVLAICAILAFHFSRMNGRLRQEMGARRLAQERLSTANAELSAQLTEIALLRDRLHEQAIRDPLTGLFNRRYLEETLGLEMAQARRSGLPVSVVLVDADRFKEINDGWGHPVGDLVLRALADLLATNVREGDIVCRYGGEEILLLLPNMPFAVAMERAEAWRRLVAAQVVEIDGAAIRLTVSVGVASFPEHGDDGTSLVAAADRALYEAKSGGRDRVVALPAAASGALQPA